MAYYNNGYQTQGGGFYGIQQPMQPMQPMQMQPQMQPMQMPMQRQELGLQGKVVDNIEVVKAMDIPLNGSVSYFPIADGTAIASKQIMMDGTSKTIIYKPVTEAEENIDKPEYITIEDFNKKIKEVDVSSFKDEIKNIKRQIEDLTEDIKDINKDIKKRKD